MPRQLPAPRSSERSPQPLRPEVIVVGGNGRQGRSWLAGPLARLILNLAPDVIQAVERSRSSRAQDAAIPLTRAGRARVFSSSVELSEVEYDLRVPFLRKITVRRAAAWASDAPEPLIVDEPRRSGRLRRAGLLGAGACMVAVLGVLANRGGPVSGIVMRRRIQ